MMEVDPLRKGVFLDRDGVLNVDRGYLFRWSDWEWIPGAREAIQRLHREGWVVIVVTNQSGIARGFYTECDLHLLHERLREELPEISAIYHCPHGPNDGCECRKPKPGMILRGIEEFKLDPAQSFLIGDKPSDVEAAVAAGIEGFLFTEGNLDEFSRQVCSRT